MPLSAVQNAFSGNPLDRASDRRRDAEWLARRLADPSSSAVALWRGRLLAIDEAAATRLARLPIDLARGLAGPPGDDLLFLGLDGDAALFAVAVDGAADPAEGPLAGRGAFQELRGLAALLSPEEAGIAATAKAVFEWRARHRFCSACGQATDAAEAGWKTVCPACRVEHFPRTDPVVIMLALHGERCMLGRGAAWPEGRFSALAGFLEPGETIEEACARELKEEAGLHALAVRYHSSQPWPWPSSLMIGLMADVAAGEGAPDQTELVEIRWFTRPEAADLLAGRIPGLTAPPPLAIAHQLLKSWIEEV